MVAVLEATTFPTRPRRPPVPILRRYSWDYLPATDRSRTKRRPSRRRAIARSTGTSVDSCRSGATADSRVLLLSKVILAGFGTALVRQGLVLRAALLHHSFASGNYDNQIRRRKSH